MWKSMPELQIKTSLMSFAAIMSLHLLVLAAHLSLLTSDDQTQNKSNSDRCPYAYEGTPPEDESPIPSLELYNLRLSQINIQDVLDDLDDLFTDSQDCWPSDTYESGSSYAPFFVRLAWHCSGTYRNTDEAGGCGGGRQRFNPEASWPDNTNLDKARALLGPIKAKHGVGLSWGDLFVLAGTQAILTMGGPINEICMGRIDNGDGSESFKLGHPEIYYPEAPPCEVQGDCQPPLGADTVGLIYVNPEGFMGDPDPARSAVQVRNVFARMGVDDRGTVALIGGGHAFGKAHGACPDGPGCPPNECPLNPWVGRCGTGKGADTVTSGIEGHWTSDPLKWDNAYFQYLVDDDYELWTGPGGHYQWRNLAEGREELMMMTTDVALVHDEAFKAIVEEFANDIHALNEQFAASWEKLTTDGATWAREKKCIDKSESWKKKKADDHDGGKVVREEDVYEAAESGSSTVDETSSGNAKHSLQSREGIYIGTTVLALGVVVMAVAVWKYVCSRMGMKEYITSTLSEEYGATLELSSTPM